MVGYYLSVGLISFYSLAFLLFLLLHSHDEEAEIASGKKTIDSPHSSGFASYFAKPLSLASCLQREIFFIPNAVSLLCVFYCTVTFPNGDNFKLVDQCQSQIHMFYMALAGFMLFLSLVVSMTSSMYFNDTQPDSPLPWANCDVGVELLKLLRKIVIVVCYVLSFNVIYKFLICINRYLL